MAENYSSALGEQNSRFTPERSQICLLCPLDVLKDVLFLKDRKRKVNILDTVEDN